MYNDKCCDNCKCYHWYTDYCDKCNCEVDARAIYNCFEKCDTPVLDAMISRGKSMNNIEDMPPMCHDCSMWEIAEKPYFCGDCEERRKKIFIKEDSKDEGQG